MLFKIDRYPIKTLLFLFTILTRVPFASKEPYGWDAFSYSFALDKLRLMEDMPHFPGYFWRIVVSRPLHWLISDAHNALIVMAWIVAATSVVLFYSLARNIAEKMDIEGDQREWFALFASGLMILNPMFWHYSSVAMAFIYGSLIGVLIPYILLSSGSSYKRLILGALLIGFMSGFRLETLLLSFLWIYVAIENRAKPSIWILSIIAGLIGVCSWVVPTFLVSGDPLAYYEKGRLTLSTVREDDIALGGGMVVYLLGMGKRFAALIILLTGGGAALWFINWKAFFGKKSDLSKRSLLLFACWVIPIMVILWLGHLRSGYTMILQAPLILLVAYAVIKIRNRKLRYSTVAVMISISILFFLLPIKGENSLSFTAAKIRYNDTDLISTIDELKPQITDSTAIVIYGYEDLSWRSAMYYLPDVPAYHVIKSEKGIMITKGYQIRETIIQPFTDNYDFNKEQPWDEYEKVLYFGEL
jgi:hypothetical protein